MGGSICFLDVVFKPELSSDEECSDVADDEVVKKRPGRPRLYPEGYAEYQRKLKQATEGDRLLRKEARRKERQEIRRAQRKEKEEIKRAQRKEREEIRRAKRKEKEEIRMAKRRRKAEMRRDTKKLKETLLEERKRRVYRKRNVEYEMDWNADEELGCSQTFEERLE